ncbi:hypothetical protein [uncultured Ferrimonas sp.]|uniref:hypothetical protein n=1 Tax=uncultured Ferrimonas sp. TaxID=432640 RepID=UPI00260957B9|nr:hypothetical protein [uncultured Ferrimonas sp.]
MASGSIARLAEQLEQQLSKLGQQRSANRLRLDQLQQQQQWLRQKLTSLQRSCSCVAQLANGQQLSLQLLPLQQQNQHKIELLTQEQRRLERLWGHILRRRQGLQWLSNQRSERAVQARLKAEQRQQDEFAARRRLNP